MKSKIKDEDVKALQDIQEKLLGHSLPEDVSRDSLETTPISNLMNEYYHNYLLNHNEIAKEKQRDKLGADFIRGGFIGLIVGIVLGWLDGDVFRIAIVGGLIGGVVGALSPPILEIVNKYSEKHNL